MTACPKCSADNAPGAPACARCGVVFARLTKREKLMASVTPPAPAGATKPRAAFGVRRDEPAPSSTAAAMARVGAVAAAVAAVAWFTFSGEKTGQRTAAGPPPPGLHAPSSAPPLPPDLAPPPAAVPTPSIAPPAPAAGLTEADVAFLQALNASFATRDFVPTAADIERVEEIRGRAADAQVGRLLVVALSRAGEQAGLARRYGEAAYHIARAKGVDATMPHPWVAEASVCSAAGDWSCAENSSRRAEALGVSDPALAYGLAFALYRQDRGRDALDVLDRPLLATVAIAQQLKALILGAQKAQADKAQFSSDRFNVRFDGEEHSGVARDVLRILDRYYLLLAETYDHRPQTVIPVVLYSQRDYYTATGAPGWSGGQYSNHSGRIDIPVRGMPTSLDPEGEGTVIHELSHAFVGDMTGGVIATDPSLRDLNEGLAQYMEGERVEKRLSAAELKRLATTSGGGVGDFYTRSLVFVEFLMKSRGQRDVNDLLRAMKETGSTSEAFQKVFGESAARLRERAFEAFWRRYS